MSEEETDRSDQEGTQSPPTADRTSKRMILAFALLAVAIVAVAAFSGYSFGRNNPSETTVSDSEKRSIEAVSNLIERYNSNDYKYIADNSCGELKARAITDLGGLMDFAGDGAPSATRYHVDNIGNFRYFSEAGLVGQIYAQAKIRYPNDSAAREFVASFTLLKGKQDNQWKVCTAYLMSSK
ncbi:hypothetical protein [Tsukamurella sp. NPDC003166]|uniref:hypothetical protein n=1 Tax=Tsukamurella sp. NPDC003166 TaxID=3154444 RepID=UPI0033B27389